MFDALARLQEEPSSWWALSVVRWTTDLPAGEEEFVANLRRFSPTALCLLSLLRPDLAEDVEEAWSCPNHARMIRWLLTSDPMEPIRAEWREAVLAPWVEENYEVITVATGALCSLTPPAEVGTQGGSARREFLLEQLGLDLEAVMDNYLCVLALHEEHFSLVEEEARRGRPAALRALTMRPEWAERALPLLFSASRQGHARARKVAAAVLAQYAERAGLPDLAALEQRMEFATAWADGGGGEAPAPVSWRVGAYEIRLRVECGRVRQVVSSEEKVLRSLPREVRQSPSFAEMRHAREELARRYRYLRGRFERAMEHEQAYSGAEFSLLMGSPAARALAAGLVLQVEGEEFLWRPTDPLVAEAPATLTQASEVKIAHPVLLEREGTLEGWREQMVDLSLGQPFKQLFREVYLAGEEERGAVSCGRFAGRPVKARQAFALLRGRGYEPGAGIATKEYRSHGVQAHLAWAGEGEPVGKLLGQAEPEAPLTFGEIWFTDSLG